MAGHSLFPLFDILEGQLEVERADGYFIDEGLGFVGWERGYVPGEVRGGGGVLD
jgi:hypothetical protein